MPFSARNKANLGKSGNRPVYIPKGALGPVMRLSLMPATILTYSALTFSKLGYCALRHSAAVATYVPGEDLTAQTATSASLPFHTHSFGGSMAIRALELGSAATGGQFNTVSDWQRLSYILAASAVAFFGYRSYTSVSGE